MVVMKELSFVLCVMVAIGCQRAQADSWQPSAGHTQVSTWPATAHDPHPDAGPEVTTTREDRLVAGRPWAWVEKVSQPTTTVYSPQGTNTGVAVVVFRVFAYIPAQKVALTF